MIDPRRNQPFGSECVMTGGAGYPINICYIHTHIHIIIYIYRERLEIQLYLEYSTPPTISMFYLFGLYIYTQEEESPGVTTVACDQASWSIALALAAIKPKASNISPRASYAAGLSKGETPKKCKMEEFTNTDEKLTKNNWDWTIMGYQQFLGTCKLPNKNRD